MSRFSVVILLSLLVVSEELWWPPIDISFQVLAETANKLITIAEKLPLDHTNESVKDLFEALKVGDLEDNETNRRQSFELQAMIQSMHLTRYLLKVPTLLLGLISDD
ncbi:hypothetical protein RB195_003439 [Necator americanus]|uniref:Uncharacterized protein n=1 Tax=Necator americanus TaxID=51031 RepID=A0ABR1DNK5_NECAM